ncbi:MAG: hypothetical protein IKP07_05130 [Bacilli bacterium]|nr:hypothetical protein [Bacilli bacterium]
MLEQFRAELRAQREKIYGDPNSDAAHKDYIDKAIKIFDNKDAVEMLSTPQIMAIAHLLGHSIPECKQIALQIEQEVSQKYTYVNPERFKGK